MKDNRTHLRQAQKTILATAILENIAVLWKDEELEGDDPIPDPRDNRVARDINVAQRQEGQMMRQRLMEQMR